MSTIPLWTTTRAPNTTERQNRIDFNDPNLRDRQEAVHAATWPIRS
jgi:hypothetical protein